LQALGLRFVIRVKGCVKVCRRGQWIKLNRLRFITNARHRDLGRIDYCERTPRRLWVTMSRARQRGGGWGIWYLVSNRPLSARQAAAEYGCRWSCEAGFKDTKWWLGFKRARVRDIRAWSRLFALFAVALLALASLGTILLIPGDGIARRFLRRVASRRRGRCELSLMMATLNLIQQDRRLLDCLFPSVKLRLEAGLPNVS
jgi:hypothetical protein